MTLTKPYRLHVSRQHYPAAFSFIAGHSPPGSVANSKCQVSLL